MYEAFTRYSLGSDALLSDSVPFGFYALGDVWGGRCSTKKMMGGRPPHTHHPCCSCFFGGVLFWGGFPFSSSFFFSTFFRPLFLSSCFVGPLLFSLDLFFCPFLCTLFVCCPLVPDFHLILFFLPNSLDALESIARDGSRALLFSEEESAARSQSLSSGYLGRTDRLNNLELPALLLSRMF